MVTFLTAVLATWRLTSMAAEEDGPFNWFVRLRIFVFSATTLCTWCTSFWAGLLVAVLSYWVEPSTWADILLRWPALSAGSIMFHHLLGLIIGASHDSSSA